MLGTLYCLWLWDMSLSIIAILGSSFVLWLIVCSEKIQSEILLIWSKRYFPILISLRTTTTTFAFLHEHLFLVNWLPAGLSCSHCYHPCQVVMIEVYDFLGESRSMQVLSYPSVWYFDRVLDVRNMISKSSARSASGLKISHFQCVIHARCEPHHKLVYRAHKSVLLQAIELRAIGSSEVAPWKVWHLPPVTSHRNTPLAISANIFVSSSEGIRTPSVHLMKQPPQTQHSLQ